MTPRVSVVINNHNYGRYLGDALESALAQTHSDTEVIVVDDGSSDDSREVISRYGSRIDAVLQANGGQASAMNAGFARCHGDVVIFLDADDVLLPEAADLATEAFAVHPSAVRVQYRMAVIDAGGRRTGAVKPFAHYRMPSGDVRREELSAPFDLPWLPTSGNAFRAEALRRLLPIPEAEYRLGADWYLLHVTPLFGEVVSLQEIGALYRVHGANGYEREARVLDLGQVRQSVTYAEATRRHLVRWAARLRLPLPPGGLLSVADLGNRLISRRIECSEHPLENDRVLKLALDGVRAATRRADMPAPARLLLCAWFVVTASAPRRLVVPLAELFMFPERRSRLNRIAS
jgi:glycosyltransferase involved in cell wall biosynthesis